MNPARTFDFVQKHPKAATVIEQFKNGDYDGLLATKGSIQLLAQALGQDVDVLTTSITSFLGIKGAFDHQTNTVVLDVTSGNRSEIVDTLGHEIAHGQGINNETSADLIGTATVWAFSSGVKNSQDTIDQYKVQLGDGKDLNTQAQNQEILKNYNQIFVDNISEHPDSIEDNTSYKQSISNSLFCWNKECTEQFKNLDKAQEAAYRQGQDRAVSKFVNDIKNLPNVPREVYEAIKNDPKGTAVAILKGIASIPSEIWDTTKIISKVNAVGDSPAEFEKLGNAEMTTALNGISALLSAGTVTVAKKGGKIVVEAAKDANLANKKLLNAQQIIGAQPYVAPKHTAGDFQTHGITVEQVPSSVRKQLLNDLKAGCFVNPGERLEQIIESGKTVPVPIQATTNTTLYKLVSTKGNHTTPHPQTEYWITRNQLNLIKANPSLTNEILGLPPQSHANTFNVFEIQPKPNSKPTIYQSQVATVTTPNSIGVGNATQTIVPNRNLWTTPKSINIQIKVK